MFMHTCSNILTVQFAWISSRSLHKQLLNEKLLTRLVSSSIYDKKVFVSALKGAHSSV